MSWDACVSRWVEVVEGQWACLDARGRAERVVALVERDLGRTLTGGERQDVGEACGLWWR
jgi:hypothetical protein